jgi:CheY-like chemotaxis protein
MRRPLKVLVVDDSEFQAQAFKSHLESDKEIRAEIAPNLKEAIERVQQGGIDAVLLDLLMPDSSDTSGVRAINEASPALPIVVLSGLTPALESEAYAAGAEDYIIKEDISKELLIRTLRHAVIRREVRAKFGPAYRSMHGTNEAIKEAEVFKKAVDVGEKLKKDEREEREVRDKEVRDSRASQEGRKS